MPGLEKITNGWLPKWRVLFIFIAALSLILGGSSGNANTIPVVTLTPGPATIFLSWTNGPPNTQSWQIYRSTVAETLPAATDLFVTLDAGTLNYTDHGLSTETALYYLVRAVTASGDFDSTRVGATPWPQVPHGNYSARTTACRICHTAHGAQESQLIALTSTASLCYRCHSQGDTLDVLAEYLQPGSTHPDPGKSCAACHDAHDGGQDRNGNQIHLPRLLEVTLATEPLMQGGGNQFCFTCHDSLQGNYPLAGSGHNLGSLASAATGITCLGCHQEHGSSLVKLLRVNPAGSSQSASGNDRSFCYTCHQDAMQGVDNTWEGMAIAEQGHAPGLYLECEQCHSPHGAPHQEYLNASYDQQYSDSRTEEFAAGLFQTCVQSGCHSATALNGEETLFSDAGRSLNLHQYHLNLANQTGAGNAICKECHRPHGARSEENPSAARLVGFPAATVTPRITAVGDLGPEYLVGDNGGSCNLVCHGSSHAASDKQPGEILSQYQR